MSDVCLLWSEAQRRRRQLHLTNAASRHPATFVRSSIASYNARMMQRRIVDPAMVAGCSRCCCWIVAGSSSNLRTSRHILQRPLQPLVRHIHILRRAIRLMSMSTSYGRPPWQQWLRNNLECKVGLRDTNSKMERGK